MRKITKIVMATGLIVALVVGCGEPSKTNMVQKLQTEAQQLGTQNYKSTAMMTVQMDNSAQTYYIETWYESQDVYRIALGDGNKNINQIIVRNKQGMYIVSPSLQKVFRFNGNWAQNQGHIYLYDQVLQQITAGHDVQMAQHGSTLTFDMPVTPASDVVTKEHVEIDAHSLQPKKIVLLDKENRPVVSINYLTFQSGVKFQETSFDPHKMVGTKETTKTAMAPTQDISLIEPANASQFGDKLAEHYQADPSDILLRYSGNHNFALEEWLPEKGADAFSAYLVDLYGVPALYTGDMAARSHQLVWLNHGIEFAMTSANMSLDQMKAVAISTFAQPGK